MISASEAGPSVLGQYIPLHYHYHMLGDRARMHAFKETLSQVVPPRGKVLDLGGGTGALSFFAAQRASKVWCVEINPELARAARELLSANGLADRVEIIEADASFYVTPEPVDVVICEMLHVGLLREKQSQVLSAFKENYIRQHGPKLPLFVPEASILAVQPVQQNFNFSGFEAAVPIFQDPLVSQDETRDLTAPYNYQMLVYNQPLPDRYRCDTVLSLEHGGKLNALRFITKNVVGILVSENRSIDWFNQYLILPLKETLQARPGQAVRICFSYQPGDPIEQLRQSISVSFVSQASPLSVS